MRQWCSGLTAYPTLTRFTAASTTARSSSARSTCLSKAARRSLTDCSRGDRMGFFSATSNISAKHFRTAALRDVWRLTLLPSHDVRDVNRWKQKLLQVRQLRIRTNLGPRITAAVIASAKAVWSQVWGQAAGRPL